MAGRAAAKPAQAAAVCHCLQSQPRHAQARFLEAMLQWQKAPESSQKRTVSYSAKEMSVIATSKGMLYLREIALQAHPG